MKKWIIPCILVVIIGFWGFFSSSRVTHFSQVMSPEEMPLEAGLMYLFARDHPTIFEVETTFELRPPVALKPPTTTDPLWWFVYHHQGFVLELATNAGEPKLSTIDELITVKERKILDYAGFFKWRTPEEASGDDGYSTYQVPTTGTSAPNPYADFLRAYNLRTPISIAELEIALSLAEPINIENPSPVDGILWRFFYQTTDLCIIRLYGRDVSASQNLHEDVARERREDFLFTGYWVVACSE